MALDELIWVSLTINGVSRRVRVSSRFPLARVLRDELQLTGTKVGCGTGDCGSCTVLMNGEAVCACLVPAAQCEHAEIITVEDSSQQTVLEVLRHAFLQHGALQCGFCTPGMLMAACALLRQNPAPDPSDVTDALGGVLCRCTGYVKIVDAVLDAAAMLRRGSIEPRVPREGDAVGARIPRIDGLAKLNGSEVFAADIAPPRALWLRTVRSPVARGRFRTGDITPLYARYPGLLRVLTAADVPGVNRFGIYPDLKDQPVLADGWVRYEGEAVLALVGERATLEAISDEELPIEWFPEEPITTLAAARAEGALRVHDERPDNLLTQGRVERGAIDNAERQAAAVVEQEWETSFVEHAYIEPEAGFAEPLPDNRLRIFACTQTPYMDKEETARILGIHPDQVRVTPSACGGGFGGKLDLSVQPLVALAAWTLRRPVRMIYSRGESMRATTKRHPAHMKVRVMADGDGKISGFRFHADFDTGAYASWGPTVAGRVPVHAAGPYAVPNVRCTTAAYYTNMTPAGAFRGFGTPQGALARELALDQLADVLKIDRWMFRYRNVIRTGDITATGQVLHASVGMAACLEAVEQDWREMLRDAQDHNRQGEAVRRGVGIGCMWYGCGNTAMPNPARMRLTLTRDGTLTLYSGAVDVGQGASTVLLQICADAVGLPVHAFRMVVGDTDRTEDAGKTSASRQTFVSGKAAYLAGRAMRKKLIDICHAEEEARLRLDGTRLIAQGDRRTQIVGLETLAAEGGVVADARGMFDPPATALDENGQGEPYATYAFAAQICSVDVDTRLGTVAVRRMVAAHDVGKAINPTLVEGQIHGGILQGIGMALMEEYVPGRTNTFRDYAIPTIADVPQITVKLIEDPEPLGPFGAKGVGEPALVPTPAAVVSAVRHATGVVVNKLPILPYRLHRALHGRSDC